MTSGGWALAALLAGVVRVTLFPFKLALRIKRTVVRVVSQATRNTINGIKATPGAIWRVPVRM